MRLPVFSLFFITAALVGETQATYAQSAVESYPWCAIDKMRTGARSCYYTSYEQCMTTMFGIGGFCVQSPYYHPRAAPPPSHAARNRSHAQRAAEIR
jgi:Protein of unknown function (DUF3551)